MVKPSFKQSYIFNLWPWSYSIFIFIELALSVTIEGITLLLIFPMRTQTLFIICGLLLYSCFSQAQNLLIDSLKAEWLKSSSIEKKATILEELCFQFFYTARQDSLDVYASQLKGVAVQSEDKQLEALALFYESQSYYHRDSAKIFEFSGRSIILAEQLKFKECLSLNYLGQSLKYRNLMLYKEGLESALKGLHLTEGQRSKRFLEIKAALHTNASVLLHYQGNYSDALQHALNAVRLGEQLKNLYIAQKAYSSSAGIYGELYSPDNNFGTYTDRLRYKTLAKYFMLKAYEGSLVVSSKRVSAVAAYNLGLFFSEANQPDSSKFFLDAAIQLGIQSNYYELLSNAYNVKGGDLAKSYPDSAMYFLNKAIHHAAAVGFISNQATAMISKATLLNEMGRTEEALALAEEALELSLQSEVQATQLNAYKLLSQLHEVRGDNDKAYAYFKKHIEIKDSLISAENYARIEELKTRYDTELKDSEIQNLSKTTAIQQLTIRQRNFTVIGLAIFIVFASGGVWLYVRQRNLVQQKKQIDLENRFLRFQLNPHFMSNALVSIQRFVFERDQQQAGDYLARFARLMRQFLEYSRKDVIPIEDEVEVLRNYLDIQKLSFANGFEYQITVDASLDVSAEKIPPLFAQPFVENAIEHGIKGVPNGKIAISFSKSDQFVELVISDNGKGITEPTPGGRKSLATTIIRERIDLLNKVSKQKITLKIGEPVNGQGTSVHLLLPIYF